MLPKPIGLYQMQVWKPIIRQFHEVVIVRLETTDSKTHPFIPFNGTKVKRPYFKIGMSDV